MSWPGTPGALEALEVEALVVDRYLDGLLAAAERRAADAPADAALDPALRAAALRLRDEVVRVHPSFREERLARRLAAAAAAMRLAPAAGGEVAPMPPVPELAAFGGEPADPADPASGRPPGAPHPLLVGGAVTSALLSIAGAAFVAWRLTHGAPGGPLAAAAPDDPLSGTAPDDPLARAARTVRAALPRGLA
jgi:hypothetical protein